MTKSLSFKKTGLALAVALSLPAISAQAADSYKAQDVVVTASRVEQQLADVNMSVSVITSDEIEQNAGAQTIGDLLEHNVPGIRVQNDGGQGIDRVSIRGEDPFRTVVMVDGQRISEQKSMSGVPLLIDPSQVERIEIIRGPASVLYGSDAVGGAINIITKKGGDKPFGASVSAGFNSSASGKDLSASIYGATGGWKYRLGASIQNFDNLDTPRGELENTDFQSKSANAFLSYDIDPNKTVGLSLSHYELDFMSGSILYSADDFWVDVPEWKRTRGAVFGEFKNLTDSLARLRIDLSQERNDKNMLNHVHPSAAMPLAIENYADNTLDTTGLNIQADWLVGDNHYLITGYEFTYDKLDASSLTNMAGVSMPITIPWKNQEFDGSQIRHALFATMESTFAESFVLNYGVRYTWVRNDMDVDTLYGDLPSGSYKDNDGKAVFNFGASYKGFDNLTLRANWSQGYRAPILQELYVDTSMGQTGITYANSDLKPETSDNFEIGARYANGIFTADAAIFYSEADDYITTIAISPNDEQYTNIGQAKTLGFELDTSLKLGNFEPYTILTLMRREYEENGITTTKSGTPKVSARYGLRYSNQFNGAKYHVDAYAISQSKTEQWDFEADEINPDGTFGGATYFNLAGGISFGSNGSYSLNAGLYNITDKAYQTNGSTYEAGRHFAIKLNAKF